MGFREVGRSIRLATYGDLEALKGIFRDPKVRREFARSLRRPAKMRRPLRHVLVILITASIGLGWVLGYLTLLLLQPAFLDSWNAAWGLWWAAFITTVGIPIPFEPALLAVAYLIGSAATVVIAAAGKTFGAGIVFFIGGNFRSRLERWKSQSVLLRRFLDFTERFVKQWSYPAFALMLALPFFPDTLPVYLFAIMKLKWLPFILASFVGVAIRSAIFLGLLGSL